MKKIMLLASCLLLTVATTVAGQKVPVFLYAGQSNADGREYTQNLPDYMKQGGSLPSSPYTHLKWASICGNPSKTAFDTRTFNSGERYAFCDVTNYWIDQAVSGDFYAIKCAYGGTAIAPGVTAEKLPIWYADAEWMTTHNAYCGQDITQAAYANNNSLTKNLTEGFASLVDGTLAALDAGYDVKAIMWHQGESDRNAAGSYYTNFKTMIAYMRQAIYQKTGDEADLTLPFIFGTVCRRSTQYNATVEAAQKQVAAEDDNVYYIDMKNATLLSDNLHFDKQATEYLGKKMYNLLVELGLVSGEQVAVEEFPVKESVMDGVEVPSPDNRSWNFTSFSQDTKDALAADVALTSGALWNQHSSYGYRRGGSTEEEQLHTAGGYVIPETKGLYFTCSQGNRVALQTSKNYMVFVTGDPTVFVPKLVAGQLVSITAAAAKNTIRVKLGQDMDEFADVVTSDEVGTDGGTVTFRVKYNVTLPTHIGFRTSGAAYIKKIEVKTPETVNILIGADRIETFAASRPLDFSPFTDLFKAYIVTGYDDKAGTVTIEQVDQVPAGTGVLLIGEECTVNVPVVEGTVEALPAVNLLTAVVGSGEAPAGSFTLTTSSGVTQLTRTATAKSLENQAYLLLKDATKAAYGFKEHVRLEQLATPALSLSFSRLKLSTDMGTAVCELSSDNSKLKTAPEAVSYYYRVDEGDWIPFSGSTFSPAVKGVYSFKAAAEGYDDSEATEAISLAAYYQVTQTVDLTSETVYTAATNATGAFSWGDAWGLPADQEYGKLSKYNAISGLAVQNNNLAARYSFAKGVGLANNYGYTVTTAGAPADAFAEYVFYQNHSLADLTSTFVFNPDKTAINFPLQTTGALKAVNIYSATALKAGDANGDGEVNVVDATVTISHVLAQPTVGFLPAVADVNADGDVNIVDVTLIIDKILSK